MMRKIKKYIIKIEIFLLKSSIIIVPIIFLLFLKVILPYISQKYNKFQFKGEVEYWETEHFKFFSRVFGIKNKITKITEEYYTAFYNTLKSNGIKLNQLDFKPVIFLFKNRDEFVNYHKSVTFKNISHNMAYYRPLDYKVIMYWNKEIKKVIYHEFTHLFLDVLIPYESQWNTWFNEGLAVYFENSTIKDKKLFSKLNKEIVFILKYVLYQNKFISINKILKADSKDFEKKDNYLYYYESYIIIYYLLNGPEKKYRKKFWEYFKEEEKRGKLDPEIFWEIIETSQEVFTKELKKFILLN